MTVNINGFTVDIKAKGVCGGRYNDVDTKAFLHDLKNILVLASNDALNRGLTLNVECWDKAINEIIEVLLKNGYPEEMI